MLFRLLLIMVAWSMVGCGWVLVCFVVGCLGFGSGVLLLRLIVLLFDCLLLLLVAVCYWFVG